MASEWQDPYLIPGTDILANKLGLNEATALRQAEYELTAYRLELLADQPLTGRFDLDHMQRIHAFVFQDVYEWAGELRSVDIAKGGTRFAHSGFIEAAAGSLTVELRREGLLQGLDKEQFVERLAHYYAEWNALHPFREGNGRTTREFIGQLAEQAGYSLDQTVIDNSKGAWNEAARFSFIGDLGPIKEFFTEAVRDSRAVAFEKLPEIEAIAKFPELANAFATLRAVERSLADGQEGGHISVTEGVAAARADIIKTLDAGGQVDAPASQENAPSSAGARSSDLER